MQSHIEPIHKENSSFGCKQWCVPIAYRLRTWKVLLEILKKRRRRRNAENRKNTSGGKTTQPALSPPNLLILNALSPPNLFLNVFISPKSLPQRHSSPPNLILNAGISPKSLPQRRHLLCTRQRQDGDGLLCVDSLRLPVSAGAAGALGATYCSPYVVDGAHHARPSGQTSETGASSQENNLNKTNKEWKPSQRLNLGKMNLGSDKISLGDTQK